ncbi:L-amino acid oxidase isoform X2 [Lepeophtheirus salmonis]|uniref:L-amino acid oxidase isoform X2 n=1 Tax=Lepeophtheirus salmonis TaxID=72036 RepID=UPI001AE1224D|nr:L-amino acid oxidase-like isoform X2 [Lepeophtheirus salmonis]
MKNIHLYLVVNVIYYMIVFSRGQIEDSEPFVRSNFGLHKIAPSIELEEEEILQNGGDLVCHDRNGHDELFSLFVIGLTKRHPIPTKVLNITIVGAGITGLTAGILLKNAGHNVQILEASHTLGGRIQTFRNVEEEWHVEWGPMRFPRNQFFTQYLLHKFQLRLTEFKLSSNKTFYFIGGQTFSKSHYSNVYELPFVKILYNLTREEMNIKIKDFYNEPMKAPLQDLATLPWKEFVKKYDKYSFRSYLREKQGYSPGLVHLIGTMAELEGLMDMSMVEVTHDECIFGQSILDTIVDGTDTLIQNLAKEIISQVSLNTVVKEIYHSKDATLVKFNCIGFDCQSKHSSIKSDFVILTPLPTVVSRISFSPLLTTSKRYTLRTARISSAVKVVLTFNTPFWEKLGIKGGKSVTDLPSKSIVYPSFSFKGGLGVLLVSYTWGTDASRQEGMTDDDIITECLYTLSKVHNLSEKEVRIRFRKGYVKKWGKDPFTVGAFGAFAPHFFNDWFDEFQKPEGRVVFAGDTYENLHGWIDSSLKSATRAFKYIHDVSQGKDLILPADSPFYDTEKKNKDRLRKQKDGHHKFNIY